MGIYQKKYVPIRGYGRVQLVHCPAAPEQEDSVSILKGLLYAVFYFVGITILTMMGLLAIGAGAWMAASVLTPRPTITPSDTPTPTATPTPTTMTTAPRAMTTEEAKSLIGVDVQRLATEPNAWVFRDPEGAVRRVRCPREFVCTLDTGEAGIFVYIGDSTLNVPARAGTFRFRLDVDSCTLLRKEQENGRRERPAFEVAPGNFECPPQ
ncbi:MAG: hypothetical protein N2691_02650 [Patescibacteria group bacterium]|nr:hypothetical protein [Patescibacteria group bacterium]